MITQSGGVLRENWKWVTLLDVAEVITGNTPPTADATNYGDAIPFVKPTELVDRSMRFAPNGLSKYAISRARSVPAGAVLVSCIGNLGKTGIARVPVAFNQQINALVFKDCVIPEFGFYYAQTLKSWLYGVSSATTLPIVNKGKFQQAAFPLAPLDDQRAIVAEIEKQFSRLDEAVANLKRVKANLKRYKAAVLKAAVEGRLVPIEADLARKEGRGYETGGELLCRMLETRRSQRPRKGKYLEPIPAAAPEHRVLPEGWVWTTIGHLLSSPIINGLSIKGSDAPPGVAALKLNAMTDSGFDYKQIRYLPIDVAKVKDILIREGDFYISRGNGSLHLVGRGTIAQPVNGDVIFPDTMMRLRFLPEVTGPNWPQSIWESRLIRQQIEQRLKTTAGIYKIAQPQVASILIPLPPHAEQCRIVAEVARRLSIARLLESQVETNVRRGVTFRSAMLRRAFFGGLGESSG